MSALPDGDGNEQFMTDIVCCVSNVAVNKCCIPFSLICETNYGVLESKPNRHKLTGHLVSKSMFTQRFFCADHLLIYTFFDQH